MSQLATAPEESLESLIAGLADEFAERLERGERPDPDEFAGRYPEYASVIRQVLSCLNLVRLSTPSPTGPRAVEGELAGVLGDYRLIREIGRGGMGVVYEAEQISLRRRVALKVLPFASALDQRHLQRFRNEAHAAAQLHHTSIVPVYAVGFERGVHFYAMQFIDGHSLADVIRDLHEQDHPGLKQRPASAPKSDQAPNGAAAETAEKAGALSTELSARGPGYFRTIARLGIQAAEALEYAHQHGVIHRDIKPANLLVDNAANLWVADFGLAQVRGDARLTMTGDLLGTLRYMCPEQALGQREATDHRGDVYSLGITLYELLTLQPAFPGNDRKELIRQIAFEEPKPPRKVNRHVPAELETIVVKAIAKVPGERYASAQQLADDLRRYLDDRPITARRPTVLQRVRKWVRRHFAVVTTATVCVVVALMITAAVLTVSNIEVRTALNDRTNALQKETEASVAREIALENLKAEERRTRQALSTACYLLRDRAQAAGEAGYVSQALVLLTRAMQIAPENEAELQQSLRTNYSAWKLHVHPLKSILDHGQTVSGVAISPDGSRWATCSKDGTTRIWDSRTNEPIGPAGPRQVYPTFLQFSPDSRFLITATVQGFQVRDARTGETKQNVPRLDAYIHLITISLDGNRLLITFVPDKNRPAGYEVWSTETGKRIGTGPLPTGTSTPFFSHDGHVCAITLVAGKVTLWDSTKAGAIPSGPGLDRTLHHATAPVFANYQSNPNTVHLLHGENGIYRRGNGAPVAGFLRDWCFTHDGRYLLVLSTHQLSIISVHDNKPSRVVDVGDPDAKSVIPAMGGAGFLLIGPAGVILGDAEEGALHYESVRFTQVRRNTAYSRVVPAALAADGTLLLAESGGIVRVRSTTRHLPGRESLSLTTTTTPQFSRDRRFLVFTEAGRGVRFWDRNQRKLTDRLIPLAAEAVATTMHPTRNELLVWTADRQFTLWSLDTLERVRGPIPLNDREATKQELRVMMFSPDGREFLPLYSLSTSVFDIASGKRTTAIGSRVRVGGGIAYSPDGRWIACAGTEGKVFFWDRQAQIASEVALDVVYPIARLDFASGGDRLICLLIDGTLQTWDVASGRRVGEIPSATDREGFGVVVTDPAGRLTCAGRDRITFIDPRTGNQIGPTNRMRGMALGASIDPDGRMLAVSTADRIELIELPGAAEGDAVALVREAQVLTGLSFDERGTPTPLSATEWQDLRRQRERDSVPLGHE
jgi:serine/threonine protein kinase/WD40 repeat protein